MTEKKNFRAVACFTVRAESKDQANEFVRRLLRYGFNAIADCEPTTDKAIKDYGIVHTKTVEGV